MKHIVYFFLLASFVFYSCEDVIDPKLERAEPVLVVDAWINNLADSQKVILTRTQPYFDNVVPPALSGATVTITDQNGTVFTFTEEKPGEYVWVPSGNNVFGAAGLTYTLSVQTGGETFVAESRMGQVPVVDSITFFVQEGNQFFNDLYQAEFWAKDPVETQDAYWIKFYKNGVHQNKPGELITAYDAGFSKGGNFNGIEFIPPIRRAINPFDTDENDALISPYQVGDSVSVQIHAITESAFNFLNEVSIQTDRPGGFGELFSTPLANVSTNIRNTNTNGSKVVGFFNVASVSGLGRKFNSLDDVTEN
ncbi:MAG TPA: DUF4249 domain-containing protein [Cyclobacteriaceae bacterium]|nr:DUF4249 domain-containing protein [Cyclobacteriaceae bacterium]HRF34006.1 DUF4249 domain-containing protein [Cyclobacteriaceae bacterium]